VSASSLLSLTDNTFHKVEGSERAFSAAGIFDTHLRTRLSDRSIDTLRFLRAFRDSNFIEFRVDFLLDEICIVVSRVPVQVLDDVIHRRVPAGTRRSSLVLRLDQQASSSSRYPMMNHGYGNSMMVVDDQVGLSKRKISSSRK